jgi:flavin reductase (DIM6/NTAB) family NADH-FMN oxidoreductase RutF
MTNANLDQIDSVLRLIDREVWIVTAAAEGKRSGLTATWVSAASIDPQQPVLLVGLAPNHFTAELIEKSHAFVAHLLRTDQGSLAFDFSKDSGRQRDKLAGLEFAPAVTGAPVLRDCLAWLDCRVFARHNAGDRLFYWADVVAAGQVSAGTPLKEQAFFGNLSPEQKQSLIQGRSEDIEILRPLASAWRSALDIPRPP